MKLVGYIRKYPKGQLSKRVVANHSLCFKKAHYSWKTHNRIATAFSLSNWGKYPSLAAKGEGLSGFEGFCSFVQSFWCQV